jgi:hypothetical protein
MSEDTELHDSIAPLVTPESQAFGDYVDGVIANPYKPGSIDAQRYDRAMQREFDKAVARARVEQ